MKMYTNMTNIIVRISCGEACDENAVLLNGHYDTTLGSPGAVDDALPIGVMLEVIRIVSQRPAPRKNSLIFCKQHTPQRTHRCALSGYY
jgi:Zn-dependent M28 family amino/carboxypeptidase